MTPEQRAEVIESLVAMNRLAIESQSEVLAKASMRVTNAVYHALGLDRCDPTGSASKTGVS